MIDYLMQQLSLELQIDPPLKAEVRGTYVIPIEEDLSITVTVLPLQGIMLSSTLGKIPGGHEEAFFEGMLRGNLFGDGTHGAVLGISPDGANFTLNQIVERRIDYSEFRNIFEDFINTADFWRSEALEQKSK